jgi:hypothetical protein
MKRLFEDTPRFLPKPSHGGKRVSFAALGGKMVGFATGIARVARAAWRRRLWPRAESV